MVEVRTENLSDCRSAGLIVMLALAGTLASSLPARAELAPPSQGEKVLSRRLNHILSFHEKGLVECSTTLEPSQGIQPARLARDIRKSTEAVPLAQLSLLRRVHDLRNSGLCVRRIQKSEKDIWDEERRLFKLWRLEVRLDAPASIRQTLLDLDPHCSTPVGPNPQGYRDTNPCFAGDLLVWRRISKSQLAHEGFISALERAIQAASDGDTIDIWKLYVAANPYLNDWDFHERVKFIGFIAYGLAATTTNAGFVDGFGELSFREDLDGDNGPDAALKRYFDYKSIKRSFLRVWEASRRKDIKLTIFGEVWNNLNRHDTMAAFIACELATDEVSIARLLAPALVTKGLGIAYESKDFLSHLREGVSMKNSVKNFVVDVGRYSRGVQKGLGFCRFEKEM